MKIRTDFVTNSSSSSFIIAKRHLDEDQILALRNHDTLGAQLGIEYWDWGYNIEENDDFITGYTSMDNFDIGKLMSIIGIDPSCVTWGEYPFSLNEASDDSSDDTEDESPDWRSMLHDLIG